MGKLQIWTTHNRVIILINYMANLIPLAIADVELQISTAIAIGATSFTLNSAHDDDGVVLPAGKYCFTIDSGTSNKEYLLGQLNGVNVTGVVSVSRQGAETVGAVRTHRVGSPAIITNFAALQRTVDILRGVLPLDGASPVGYDAEPTLADRKDLATVGYVLDNVTGGTVVVNAQVLSGNGGEAIIAGNLVYFNTADQEWYKTDADTAATIEGVQLGIALGTGSNGVAISGGIQISGSWLTSGLTAGALYYASNTAGAISSSAGTFKQIIGLALSTTRLLLIPRNPRYASTRQEDAMAGGSAFGTPSTTNKFITESYISATQKIDAFTSNGTWTKPAGCKFVEVLVIGAGGGGGGGSVHTVDSAQGGAGGAGGGISIAKFAASILGATETVTTGVGGAGGAGAISTVSTPGTGGSAGTASSFGTFLTAGFGTGGTGGTGSGGTGGIGGIGLTYTGTTGGIGGIGTGPGSVGTASTISTTGGGGGGASNSTLTKSAGGAGGAITPYLTRAGGAGGASTPTIGSNGNSPTGGEFSGGTGAGGGGGNANATGANGGVGGYGGGGGGGGGCYRNTGTVTAGTGGQGGQGFVVVISYL